MAETDKRPRGAPKGSRNAAKPDHLRRKCRIVIHCTEQERDDIAEAAGGVPVATWIRRKLLTD